MKLLKILLWLVLLFKQFNSTAQQRIVIEGNVPPSYKPDSIELAYSITDHIGAAGDWKKSKQRIINNRIKWVLFSKEPLMLLSKAFFGDGMAGRGMNYIVEPGDSIYVENSTAGPVFYGKGSPKFTLLYSINIEKGKVKIPENPKYYLTKSLEDYLTWNSYLNQLLRQCVSLIDGYKPQISAYAYNQIRSNIISGIEGDRLYKFWQLTSDAKRFGLTGQDLVNICDSTLFNEHVRWIQSLSANVNDVHYFYALNRVEIFRRFGFDFGHDSLSTDSKRRLLYYKLATEKYKGIVRENLLAYMMTSQVINELGFVPEAEKLLADYYSTPGYSEYKSWVKAYEAKARELVKGRVAPDFQLTDKYGKPFTRQDLAGKIALIDFWFTGCKGCAEMTPVLRKVESQFRNDTGVVFVSVSTDKERNIWLKSLGENKYTTASGVSLYTSELGVHHPMIKSYNVSSFPRLFLISSNGRVVENPVGDPREDNGSALINLIRQELVKAYDGPYVFYQGDKIVSHEISSSGLNTETYNKNDVNSNPLQLTVQTDQPGKSFGVTIKSALKQEPSEYERPDNIFILSDIEGNFPAFRKLLQANNVIDSNYNWIFGKGHLVLNGDFFDRGEQVTQCLWLIYMMEEKARISGGYVHFILGNHEIMNLNEVSRYLHPKYKSNSQRLGKVYAELYDKNSELGRWLRTKNIMEKIGDILFVHGGIGKETSELPLSITQINDLARTYYDKDSIAKQSSNYYLKTLFATTTSPFWYRLYYLENDMKVRIGKNSLDTLYKASREQVDRSLAKFKVNQIITGHTIVADTVSIHYEGKVINVDTHHATQKSEALLINGRKYYRVDALGKKELVIDLPQNVVKVKIRNEPEYNNAMNTVLNE